MAEQPLTVVRPGRCHRNPVRLWPVPFPEFAETGTQGFCTDVIRHAIAGTWTQRQMGQLKKSSLEDRHFLKLIESAGQVKDKTQY